MKCCGLPFLALVLLAARLGLADRAPRAPQPQARPSLFDPARHMRVSEVKAGMKGYGLTVFKGTRIERFDVEVLSVLKNFNPKYDVVLIKCKGDYLEHTGSIAGMSGSPVFLKDDRGRDRMIGAFAYGWPLTKDPVAGVQPIEYMLALPPSKRETATADAKPTTRPTDGGRKPPDDVHSTGASGRIRWTAREAGLGLYFQRRRQAPDQPAAAKLIAGPRLEVDSDDAVRLQPLATPLMTGGVSPKLLKALAPAFSACGLTALQSGGAGGSAGSAIADDPPADISPGSVLAVPLLTGDIDMTAIGTCTEVLGDRVFGFGHPFNNEGEVDLPMGTGRINGVIANLTTSFKLGSMGRMRGRLNADQAVGVSGRLGESAPTVPLDFTIQYADGSPERTYHFDSAQHPKFTPLLAGMAFAAAVSGVSELPQYNTLDVDLKLDFTNGQTVRIADRAVNTNAAELLAPIQVPITAAADNPFEKVAIRKITGSVKISADAREAQILNVNVPKSKYRPGETVKAFVTYKPFRGAESTAPVELELPHDLPKGTYQLIISDAARYFQDEQAAKPFRFTAEKIDDVFALLKDLAGIRQNALYLRLLRHADGVAIGRTALPQLPGSRRQVLLGAGRSNMTAFVSSTVKTVPTDLVMTGAAEFAITVETHAKVEVAGPKPARPEPPAPAAKPEEPHPKPTGSEAPATRPG